MRITDKAVENIRKHLEDGKFLRVRAFPGGCAGLIYDMGIDDKQVGDIVVESDGVKVVMDKATKELMEDATIDYVEEEDGFRIDNPKASGCRSCQGCH